MISFHEVREPFELIFIDIGSLDRTVEYLAGIAAAARVRVEVVRTPTDLGIPEAVKEAINRARGEYWFFSITTPLSPSAGCTI